MNNLEFRLWDDTTNTLIYSDNFLYKVKIYLDGSFSIKYCSIKPNTNEMKKWYKETATENYILLRYTTLQDKFGGKIYEGDIVESENKKYIVKWHELGGFALYPIEGGIPLTIGKSIMSDIEIIGNVFENTNMIIDNNFEYKSIGIRNPIIKKNSVGFMQRIVEMD